MCRVNCCLADIADCLYVQVIVLDVRMPSLPVARLCNHRAAVNGITWAPHSSCHICSAGEKGGGVNKPLGYFTF